MLFTSVAQKAKCRCVRAAWRRVGVLCILINTDVMRNENVETPISIKKAFRQLEDKT